MTKVISVFNQKGGVGKTTTVINLASALGTTGLMKKKVLVVDMDPQGNTTSGLGVNKNTLETDIYTVLSSEDDIDGAVVATNSKNVDMVPSTPDLTGFEIESISRKNRAELLREELVKVKDNYDYVLIDCPPSLGMLSLNALVASDSVIIPIQAEYYALEGVSQLVSTLDMIRESLNPSLEVEGVLLSMYDGRTNLAQDVEDEVNKYFKDKVFKTVIPRNIRLAEAPSFGQSIISYDKKSKGALAYIQLAKELKKNNK